MVLFEKGMVQWDEDLINGRAVLETLIYIVSSFEGQTTIPKGNPRRIPTSIT